MNTSERVPVTRQELYDQIWSMPVSRACHIYGLSDVGLAKICAEWDIPRPPRGYWAQKQHGHPVQPRNLRPVEQGNPVVLTYRPRPAEELEPKPKPKPEPTESDHRRAFENRSENRITVPDQLTDPHALVVRTATSIRSARPDDKGLVRPRARKCLDLAVSLPLIDRSLRILDTLLKALQARSLNVSVRDGDNPRTEVLVLDERVGFRLSEQTIRQERPPTREEVAQILRWSSERKFYTSVPSGKLVLEITDGSGYQRSWTDHSDRGIEYFLNAFVVGLYRAAESIKRARVEAERRRKEQEEQERRRQDEERRRWEEGQRRQEEEARFRQLEAQVVSWARAQQIRAFLAAVRDTVGPERIVSGSDLDRWLRWAEGRANTLDPIVQSSLSRAESDPPS